MSRRRYMAASHESKSGGSSFADDESPEECTSSGRPDMFSPAKVAFGAVALFLGVALVSSCVGGSSDDTSSSASSASSAEASVSSTAADVASASSPKDKFRMPSATNPMVEQCVVVVISQIIFVCRKFIWGHLSKYDQYIPRLVAMIFAFIMFNIIFVVCISYDHDDEDSPMRKVRIMGYLRVAMDVYQTCIEFIAPNIHPLVYAIPPSVVYLLANALIVKAILNTTNGAYKEFQAGYFTLTEMEDVKEYVS